MHDNILALYSHHCVVSEDWRKLRSTLLVLLFFSAATSVSVAQETNVNLESSFNRQDEVANFEQMANFPESNRYRQKGRPIGLLEIWYRGATKSHGCTASLIGTNYLLTNHHCIDERQGIVRKMDVHFQYLNYGRDTDMFAVEVEPIIVDVNNDFVVLRTKGNPGDKYGTVDFKTREPIVGERAYMIHYPVGHYQTLTRRNCRIYAVDAASNEVGHHCDTEKGSSGSLIFAESDDAILALHYSGSYDTAMYMPNGAKNFSKLLNERKELFGFFGTENSQGLLTQVPNSRGISTRTLNRDVNTVTTSSAVQSNIQSKSPTTARSVSSRTLTASPSSIDDFHAYVMQNNVVRLEAGTFYLQSRLEPTQNTTIIGSGTNQTRIEISALDSFVRLNQDVNVNLENITIQYADNLKGQGPSTIVVTRGNVSLKNVTLEGGLGYGIEMGGDAYANIVNGNITSHQLGGLIATQNSNVVMENTMVRGNLLGIVLTNQATGKFVNDFVEGNQKEGVIVAENARITFRGNTVQGNDSSGIVLKDRAAGSFEENIISGNTKSAIDVMDSAAPEIVDNILSGNGLMGISYSGRATGKARVNQIELNGTNGIEVKGEAAPWLQDNTVEGNRGIGIAYYENATGSALNNIFVGNGEDIVLATTKRPTLKGNTTSTAQQ